MAKKGKRSVFGATLVTPVGRLCFPAIARPEAFQEGAQKKFSAMLVVNTGAKVQEILDEVKVVGEKAFGEKFLTKDAFYKPYMDGGAVLGRIEDPSETVKSLYSGRVRLIARGASDKEPPRCLLADKSQLPRRPGNEEDLKVIESTFYPGCFARIAVTPFSFDTGANKGVGLILKGIQFYKDGDRLGGADLDTAFSSEFGEDGHWEEDASGFDTPAEENY